MWSHLKRHSRGSKLKASQAVTQSKLLSYLKKDNSLRGKKSAGNIENQDFQ